MLALANIDKHLQGYIVANKPNLTKEAKETLQLIKTAFIEEDTELINRIQMIVGTAIELDGDLLEAYNNIGDNPILEPELLINKDDFEDETSFIFDIADIVLKRTKVKQEDYTIQEITSFILKVHKKVNSFRDNEGYIKTTTATENAKLPHFRDIKLIKAIEEERIEAMRELGQFDNDIDDVDDYLASIKAIQETSNEQMTPMILKITGLKKKDLTEWELDLVKENILEHMSSGLNAAVKGLV